MKQNASILIFRQLTFAIIFTVGLIAILFFQNFKLSTLSLLLLSVPLIMIYNFVISFLRYHKFINETTASLINCHQGEMIKKAYDMKTIRNYNITIPEQTKPILSLIIKIDKDYLFLVINKEISMYPVVMKPMIIKADELVVSEGKTIIYPKSNDIRSIAIYM